MTMMFMLNREVRRVPLDWEHPKDSPLFDGSQLAPLQAEWDAEKAKWDAGEFPDYAAPEDTKGSYEQWDGPRPDPAHFMPVFEDPQGIQMYETTSEGTPISEVYTNTPEGRDAMAKALSNKHDFGCMGGPSYEAWRAIIDGGLGLQGAHTGEIKVS